MEGGLEGVHGSKSCTWEKGVGSCAVLFKKRKGFLTLDSSWSLVSLSRSATTQPRSQFDSGEVLSEIMSGYPERRSLKLCLAGVTQRNSGIGRQYDRRKKEESKGRRSKTRHSCGQSLHGIFCSMDANEGRVRESAR